MFAYSHAFLYPFDPSPSHSFSEWYFSLGVKSLKHRIKKIKLSAQVVVWQYCCCPLSNLINVIPSRVCVLYRFFFWYQHRNQSMRRHTEWMSENGWFISHARPHICVIIYKYYSQPIMREREIESKKYCYKVVQSKSKIRKKRRHFVYITLARFWKCNR